MIGLGVRTNKINAGGATPPPVNTIAPVVSGTAVVGQTLTTTNGTWSNSPTSYTYQWYRGASAIGGATSSNYILVSADAGQNIKCTVTANNGLTASADSNTLYILATLLDIYPNAVAAFDFRLLRGAYYGNPCLRVRRSSDNTEQNIGFTASGNLDTTALLSFVGANNGFIVTWYDQSGNANNATQSTPTNQPQIVTSGVLNVINSKPSAKYDGTNSYLDLINIISPSGGVFSAFGVGKRTANSTSISLIGYASSGSNSILLGQLGSDNSYYLQRNTGYLVSSPVTTANQILLTGIAATTNTIRRNGTQIASTLTATTINNNIKSIGTYRSGIFQTNGDIQSVVIYSSDQTSNVSAIESNINTYYGIY